MDPNIAPYPEIPVGEKLSLALSRLEDATARFEKALYFNEMPVSAGSVSPIPSKLSDVYARINGCSERLEGYVLEISSKLC